MSEKAQVLETVASTAPKVVMYTGSGASVVTFIAQLEPWVPWIGILIALAGFIVTLITNVRKDRRESKESAARIKSYEGKCNVKD